MFAFVGESGYTRHPSPEPRTQRLTRRNRGLPDRAAITTLGAFRTFTNIPGLGVRAAYFAALGSWPGGALEERREPRDSDALMRVAVPRRRSPAGLRDLFSFLSKLRFSHSVLRAFRMCETWEVSLPSTCSACCRNAGRPLVKMAHLLFSCGQVIIFASSDRTAYKQKYHVRQQAEAQGAYFRYSSKNTFSFSNGMTSI